MSPTKKKIVAGVGGLAALLAVGGGLWAWKGKRHGKHDGNAAPEASALPSGSSTTPAPSTPAEPFAGASASGEVSGPAPTPPADAPEATDAAAEYTALAQSIGPQGIAWDVEGTVLVQHGDRFYDRVAVRHHGDGRLEHRWFRVPGPPIRVKSTPRPVYVSGYSHGSRK